MFKGGTELIRQMSMCDKHQSDHALLGSGFGFLSLWAVLIASLNCLVHCVGGHHGDETRKFKSKMRHL
jgi:hypothetical protein